MSRSSPHLTCSFCDYLAVTKGDYLNHVKRKHRFHPQFKVTCSFPSCAFTSKSWASFKMHVSKKHRNESLDILAEETNVSQVEYDHCYEDSISEMAMSTNTVSERDIDSDALGCITKICMKLECKYRCSQVALNELMDGLSDVIDLTNDRNKTIIQQHIHSLKTQYGRNKVYMRHWAYIPPQKIVMGSEYITSQGKTIRKLQTGYYIPIETLLKNLLTIPHVRKWFKNSNKKIGTNKIRADINDGNCIAKNNYFVQEEYTAKIILFYDDCEFCNPIGARTKNTQWVSST